MRSLKQTVGCGTFELWEYIVKCLVGIAIANYLSIAFPQHKDLCLWLLISVLLSITPDNNSKAAHDRIRANIIGPFVGFIMFPLFPPPSLLAVFIGVVLTILICFKLNLLQVSRTALVGLIIVMAYEKNHDHWIGAIFRMCSVVIGCLIGLAINYLFRLIFRHFSQYFINKSEEA